MKAAIIASLTVLSLTAPAFAATTEQYKFKGESASASFSQYDGCNSTYVGVYAFDNVTKDAPGAPTSQTGANLYYSSYDYCTGVGSYGYGYSENATFTSSNSLQSASLSGSFTLYDYSSAVNKTAAVDLTWTGTGDLFRGNSHSTYQGPGYRSSYRSVGAYRDASVTGTVTVDGTNLIANVPSYGSLSSSNNGSLFITKN
ncbi:hypothetical protein NIES4074_43240 [Cylindrospermum sp. NIES-4074]|nr:hypothetical protein NIES4074_43240 [Cylindrospermum sp. NIES-4074]